MKTKIPLGFKQVPIGEVVQEEDLYFNPVKREWRQTHSPGHKVGSREGMSGDEVLVYIRTDATTTKKAKRAAASK